MLLAALGSQADSNVRSITYKSEKVDFTGGVIIVSNIAIGSHTLQQLLLTHIQAIEHDLTDEEMAILKKEN